jgi:ribosomal protein S18 acetylase RimI-like enzyme
LIIKALSYLDENTIKEIRQVEAVCKDFDKLGGTIYLDNSFDFNKDIKSVFLMYDNSKLVSVLSMFIPTKQEAEVSGYTLPQYRRRGYFEELYEKAVCELKKYEIETKLLVCESQSISGKELIRKLNGKHAFNEYFMRYIGAGSLLKDEHNYRSTLNIPGVDSTNELIDMRQRIFGDSYEDTKVMIQNTFESENRIQYALTYENRFIGIGSACFEEGQVSICGLGISPEYQGMGFGREILLLILIDLLKKGNKDITIDVDSENEKAYNLYKNNGFQVKISYEYYSVK